MRARHTHYVPPPDPPPSLWEVLPSVPVDTSEAAAVRIAPHTASQREAVFQYIKARGTFGATAREVVHGITISPDSCRPRLRELQGDASWEHGQLPARIARTLTKRDGMRVYVAI